MNRKFQPLFLSKTVAAAATPEALAASSIRLYALQFSGRKAFGTDNTGNVIIRIKDAAGTWQDFLTIAPGAREDWPPPPEGGFFSADQFQIKVASDGDGVLCAYAAPV